MAQQVALAQNHILSECGVTAFVISVVSTSLTTVLVGLRFYVRRFERVAPFLEDSLILTALVGLFQSKILAAMRIFQADMFAGTSVQLCGYYHLL